MTTTGPRHWPVWAFLAAGGALVGTAALLAAPVYTAVVAAVAFVVAVTMLVVRRPPRLAAWSTLTLTSGSVAVSRVWSAVAGRPVVADRGLATGDIRAIVLYPTLAVGLLLLGGTGAVAHLADTLDASVVILGVFVLLWLFLLHGNMAPAGSRLVIASLRPIGLAVVIGMLFRLLFMVGPRAPTIRFVSVGVGTAMLGSLALIGHSVGYPVDGRVNGTGVFFTGYALLLAAALLHPSAGSPLPVRDRGAPSGRLSRGRAAMFVGLTLLGPLAWLLAATIGRFNPGSPADFGLVVLAGGLISLLLLWRLSLVARVADRRAGQLGEAVSELQGLQAEFAYRAAHDPLTGLANRSVLDERLGSLPHDRPYALLLIDLDGFKEINDSLGHPTGDELLVSIGERLTSLAPADSTLVRLGGDEFAMLLPDTREQAAMAFGTAVCTELRAPYPSAFGPLTVSASVGVTARELPARGPGEVLREADLALYAAKAAGKDRVAAYRVGLSPRGRQVRPG
ncbi:GGDEF domain-containing protein [Asanoa sp. NPDC049573]|uniref:GGDEF domain-containing protein n=1 Tax=Asanoa sp. NPDC049573 TaxID=3155396 RepID=UPI0034342831